MTTRRTLLLAAATLPLLPAGARAGVTVGAAVAVGAAAPGFTALDSNGHAVSLSSLQGRMVVLEWTNDGCPYVRKWYSGAMQSLQRDAAGLGAVWLSVISSPPGEQGYADGARANALTAERGAAPAMVLLDPKGAVARLYGAVVTPQLFVIGADGVLGYMGGADSIASTKVEDLARAVPHARNAITAIAAGRAAPEAVTRPYGCVVKYSA